jgi:hypothetical protein
MDGTTKSHRFAVIAADALRVEMRTLHQPEYRLTMSELRPLEQTNEERWRRWGLTVDIYSPSIARSASGVAPLVRDRAGALEEKQTLEPKERQSLTAGPPPKGLSWKLSPGP